MFLRLALLWVRGLQCQGRFSCFQSFHLISLRLLFQWIVGRRGMPTKRLGCFGNKDKVHMVRLVEPGVMWCRYSSSAPSLQEDGADNCADKNHNSYDDTGYVASRETRTVPPLHRRINRRVVVSWWGRSWYSRIWRWTWRTQEWSCQESRQPKTWLGLGNQPDAEPVGTAMPKESATPATWFLAHQS